MPKKDIEMHYRISPIFLISTFNLLFYVDFTAYSTLLFRKTVVKNGLAAL